MIVIVTVIVVIQKIANQLVKKCWYDYVYV